MITGKESIYPPPYPDITIARARGVYIYDRAKKRYIDLSGGAGMAIIGYGNERIKRAMSAQAEKLIVSPQKYRTEEAEKLAGKILGLFPGRFDVVMPAVTGSEAVETAMQAAAHHTGRKKFISFAGAYHGHTFAAGSLGEARFNYGITKGVFDTVSSPVKAGEVKTVLADVEKKFVSRDYAAFIVEGVITNAGYLTPPSDFYTRLSRLCAKYGVLLIADEVLAGFGRTGKMFSFEHHRFAPDMVCIAKGLASGYAAISAVVTRDELVRGYDYLATYAWPPLASSVASANIDIIKEKKLVSASRTLGDYALTTLREHLGKCSLVKEVRGKGLGISLIFNSPTEAQRIYKKCLERGVVLFKNIYVSMLFIQPPLSISKKELSGALKAVISVITREAKEKNVC